jgi:hypothetical protein
MTKRILFVEDHEDLRGMLRDLLNHSGTLSRIACSSRSTRSLAC